MGDTERFHLRRRPCSGTKAPGQGVDVTVGYSVVTLTSEALIGSGAPPRAVTARLDVSAGSFWNHGVAHQGHPTLSPTTGASDQTRSHRVHPSVPPPPERSEGLGEASRAEPRRCEHGGWGQLRLQTQLPPTAFRHHSLGGLTTSCGYSCCPP